MPEGQKTASAEGQSPPQELEEGPRSGPHLLVPLKGLWWLDVLKGIGGQGGLGMFGA